MPVRFPVPRFLASIPSLVCACLLSGATAAEPAADGPELRVMTFNIRNGAADDGVNSWDRRRDLCAARIALAAPDLAGLQEALKDQNGFLVERLKDYTAIGVARNDGKAKGEYATILYRTTRFTAVSSGTFWLSPTPDVAGSKGWDAAFPRIATWVRLRDRQAGDRELLWINTHFDHRGKQARLEAARQLRRFAAGQGAGLPLIITGDFNAEPGSAPYRALLDTGEDQMALTDAYAATHTGGTTADRATSHGYRLPPTGPHIDWILVSPSFRVRTVDIDRHHDGERFPSDHFPVTALLVWR